MIIIIISIERMSIYYQSLLGSSKISTDDLDIENATINALVVESSSKLSDVVINGTLNIAPNAHTDYVLTSIDNNGSAQWKPVIIPNLQGDVIGPSTNTIVQTVGTKTKDEIKNSVNDTQSASALCYPYTLARRDVLGGCEFVRLIATQSIKYDLSLLPGSQMMTGSLLYNKGFGELDYSDITTSNLKSVIDEINNATYLNEPNTLIRRSDTGQIAISNLLSDYIACFDIVIQRNFKYYDITAPINSFNRKLLYSSDTQGNLKYSDFTIDDLVKLNEAQTLTNKTLNSTTNNIYANGIRSTNYNLAFSGNAPTLNQVLGYDGSNIKFINQAEPDINKYVDLMTPQWLSNKRLIDPILIHDFHTSPSSSISFYLPERFMGTPPIDDYLISRYSVDVLEHKYLSSATTYFVNPITTTAQVVFNINGTATTNIISSCSSDINVSLPSYTSTLSTLDGIETFTNKTLTDCKFKRNNSLGTLMNLYLPLNFVSGNAPNTDYLVSTFSNDALHNKSISSIDCNIYNPTTGGILNFSLLDATTTTIKTNSTSSNVIITLPSSTSTLSTLALTETLTNKTLTLPKISQISNTGTLTLPTTTDQLIGRETYDNLRNKSLLCDFNAFVDATDTTKKIMFSANSSSSGAITYLKTIATGNITLTLPNITDTLISRSSVDTLYNKTLSLPIISSISNGSGILTLPININDVLVGRNTTDTLTNKTLTLPIISQISNTGTLTLPTSTDTLIGRNTTDTLTNKTLNSSTNTIYANGIRSGMYTIPYTITAPFNNNILSYDETNNDIRLKSFDTLQLIKNGGNNLNSNITIGTNDNYGLTLETNNTNRLNISNDGNIALYGNTYINYLNVNNDTVINGNTNNYGNLTIGGMTTINNNVSVTKSTKGEILALQTTESPASVNYQIGSKIYNIAVNLPTSTTTNNAVEFISFQGGGSGTSERNGAGTYDIDIVVTSAGFSVSKKYSIPTSYGATSATWIKVIPTSAQVYTPTQDFDLNFYSATTYRFFRLIRTAGTVAGVASIIIKYNGVVNDTVNLSLPAPYTATIPTTIYAPCCYGSNHLSGQRVNFEIHGGVKPYLYPSANGGETSINHFHNVNGTISESGDRWSCGNTLRNYFISNNTKNFILCNSSDGSITLNGNVQINGILSGSTPYYLESWRKSLSDIINTTDGLVLAFPMNSANGEYINNIPSSILQPMINNVASTDGFNQLRNASSSTIYLSVSVSCYIQGSYNLTFEAIKNYWFSSARVVANGSFINNDTSLTTKGNLSFKVALAPNDHFIIRAMIKIFNSNFVSTTLKEPMIQIYMLK